MTPYFNSTAGTKLTKKKKVDMAIPTSIDYI
jgi:hypothetical protein